MRLPLRKPAHRATSYNLGGVYPFSAASGRSVPGVLMGTLMDSGGAFTYDGFELYQSGALTGANGILIGRLGLGKSTYLKTYVYRSLAFGRYARVLDPKGEYRPLAERCGTEPLELRPAGKHRLNPLDSRLLRVSTLDEQRLLQDQLTLLASVCEAAMGAGRALTLEQRAALGVAFEGARENAPSKGREPIIPDVVEELRATNAQSSTNERRAHLLGMHPDELRQASREPMLALRRMVEGELAGMFDGPTSASVQLDHRLLVLDLHEVYGSAAQAVVMACAGAWMQQLLLQHRYEDGARQIWVVDEGWALLRDLATARWLLAATKFSRSYGLALWIVLHQFSDLQLAGGEDSEQAHIGQTLLRHAETKVIYGQDAAEIEATQKLMHLSNRECAVIAKLRKGQSLQRIGEKRVRVEHLLTAEELALTGTDEAMVA